MARPTKFRHALEDLTKPHLASQIAGYVSEVELYRKQVEEIQTKIAAVYDDMDEEGFDKATVRKLIAKRAKGEKAEAEAEAIDAYEIAVEKGFSSRARVGNEKSIDEGRSRAVAERPSGAEAGSAVRVGAPVSEIEHQPARLSAERDPQSVQHGSDSEGGAGGDSPPFVAGSEQGSAEEPQARNEPGSEDIASGGAGVTARPETPARKTMPLRPHCLRPELCGSYGSKHCFECERAANASEDDVEGTAIPAFVRKTHGHATGDQA